MRWQQQGDRTGIRITKGSLCTTTKRRTSPSPRQWQKRVRWLETEARQNHAATGFYQPPVNNIATGPGGFTTAGNFVVKNVFFPKAGLF